MSKSRHVQPASGSTMRRPLRSSAAGSVMLPNLLQTSSTRPRSDACSRKHATERKRTEEARLRPPPTPSVRCRNTNTCNTYFFGIACPIIMPATETDDLFASQESALTLSVAFSKLLRGYGRRSDLGGVPPRRTAGFGGRSFPMRESGSGAARAVARVYSSTR